MMASFVQVSASRMLLKKGKMKTFTVLFLFLILSPSFVFAGEIFGSITEGGRPVGQGIKVEITYAGKAYSTETDKYGSYRAYMPGMGKSLLKVHYKQQSPSIEISSYERPVRYDLVLEKQNGRYSLRRN